MTRSAAVDAMGRDAAVRDWVRRKLGSIDHELRVARIAGSLFELTHRWHGLAPGDRRLLYLAALVHDVGRAITENKRHAGEGARMLLENRSLPLTDVERRRLSCLTRHHRGHVPDVSDEGPLHHREKGDEGFKMRILLGMLRTADALDSRSMPPPRLLLTLRYRQLAIRGYISGNALAAAETFGRPKKFRLLEEMLNCEVRIEWHGTDAMALVA